VCNIVAYDRYKVRTWQFVVTSKRCADLEQYLFSHFPASKAFSADNYGSVEEISWRD